MLWIIIGIIATGIYIGYMIYDDYSWGEVVGLGFLSLIGSIMLALLLSIISGCIADTCADKTYSVAEDIEIYALRDNVTTEGKFFLGSGNVDGELKYFYVVETEFGYTVNDIDADNVYIKYTTGKCHLEKHTYTFDNSFVRSIAMPIGKRYVFYIPEGSVINDYAIDLS